MADRSKLRALLRGKNVFLDGIGMIGRTGEVEPPEVEFEQMEDGNMSRYVDTGLLKPMECKLTVVDLHDAVFDAVGKRLRDLATFVIKSSFATADGEKSVYFEIGGQVKKQSFDNLKDAGKESGIPLEISVVRYRLEIGGEEIYEIDTDEQICKIRGTDHYATLRQHTM
jgi:P2 family phage contractile tail tube protein